MPKAIFIDLETDINDCHGIYSLISFLKHNGINVDFIRDRNYGNIARKISALKPDILLYSSFSSSIPKYIAFDGIIKKSFKVKSVIGGPGPTFDSSCIENSSIDAACIGEGEAALVDFIHSGFKGSKNIFCKGESAPSQFYPLAELDKLPFPDRDVVYQADSLVRNMPSKQFLSGRGCPYECTYCFNHKFRDIFKDYGPAIRKKSVNYLLEEIRFIQKKYPLATVILNDDTFILDREWFWEFCERFPREIGLPYTCNIRANLVDDLICRALNESNCVGVNWSIESGNEYLRNVILKRGISLEQILNTSRLLTKYKIPYRIGNIIGLPGESFEQMFETLELNIRARPLFSLANIFVPFPGLALTQYAIDQGFYTPDPGKNLPKDYFTASVMNINPDSNKAIQRLLCLFPVFVRFPRLFYNLRLRKLCYALPYFLARITYEAFYAFRLMNFYVRKSPFTHKCRMAMRYILRVKHG